MKESTANISYRKPVTKIARSSLHKRNSLSFIIPLLVAIFFFAGFMQLKTENNYQPDDSFSAEKSKTKKHNFNFLALLTQEQFSENLRDTVYTDQDKYLELRIDEQILYVHYKDGRVKQYLISSGNKYSSKSIESRPGLFAIFIKEELHLSSQFNDARMFYFMPFNMGIGFHSLAGTGYYGHLGVRPSSHGCIRLRAQDARTLFNECEIGTLVLSHRGQSARVVAFTPEDFSNEKQYTKEDYMKMLAYNLNAVYEGKYFINRPKRFVIDPSVIPIIGFNIGNKSQIPPKQQIPYELNYAESKEDKLDLKIELPPVLKTLEGEISGNFEFDDDVTVQQTDVEVSSELVNKLVYNPIGILPYFPPDR
ncbi:MAG: L,D-transpeptidase [Ignavibacteria bacterium]